MFKVGDSVVCTDDSFIHSIDKVLVNSCLTVDKTYVVKEIIDNRYLYLTNDAGATRTYNPDRFRPLMEYRMKKLEKICTGLKNSK